MVESVRNCGTVSNAAMSTMGVSSSAGGGGSHSAVSGVTWRVFSGSNRKSFLLTLCG